MVVAWRITKANYKPFDGTGARLRGARWNSPGHDVIYASDTYAGAILEILAHATRPRTLPGPHHAVRVDIPDAMVETLDPDSVPGWEQPDAETARQFGDVWLSGQRTAALSVPSVAARPIGRTVMINPRHADAGSIEVSEPFDVPWDDRIF